jgi:hypothetical protein
MAAILERRVTRAAAWARRCGAFSAVLFITAGLSHRYGLLETPAFLIVLVLVALCAILALLFAVKAFSRLWKHGDIGGWDLSVGALVALLVLTPFAVSAYGAVAYPTLTDISTDVDDPPLLAIAAGKRTPGMNRIETPTPAQGMLQAEAYPNVTGRRYELPFDRTVDAVNAVLGRQGWIVYPVSPLAAEQGELTIEAQAYTLVFAFPVDVAIRVTDEDASSYVDMRSSSRYGRHDLGDNAARITTFLAELDAEVAGLAGTIPAE